MKFKNVKSNMWLYCNEKILTESPYEELWSYLSYFENF